jgi:hypothetical protein
MPAGLLRNCRQYLDLEICGLNAFYGTAVTGPVEHPPWRTRDETPDSLTHHRSTAVRVGAWYRLNAHGQVSAKLTSTLHGPTWLSINVFIGTGVTAELSLEDAALLRNGLTWMLCAAGHETTWPDLA